MKIIVGTVIAKDGRYLLVQEKKEKCYGKWNLPAGHLDDGESVSDGAVRETKEETGLNVGLTGLIGIDQADDRTAVVIIFSADIKSGEIKIDPSEILDVRWFSADEVRKLDLRDSLVINMINRFERGINYPLEVFEEKAKR